ncbi:MAG: hypothetical protein IT318_19845 [Anaerolineales bacterium]|nr:hypothetical protein [Anaerolineales bacterium]
MATGRGSAQDIAAGLWLYAQTVRIRALNRAARAARWDLLRPPLYGPAA